MKISLRDPFWLLLVAGLSITVYLSRREEARLREQAVRHEWKLRLQSEFLRNKGVSFADDGTAIVVISADGKAVYTAEGFEGLSAQGVQFKGKWNGPPYTWPPKRE